MDNHTWIIYTFGNQQTLYNILMSAGAFFGGSAVGAMSKLAIMVAVFTVITQLTGVIATGQSGRPFEYGFFFRFYILYAIFVMIPAGNIVLQDQMTNQSIVISQSSSNKIPLGVVAINSFTSVVSNGFITVFEEYFMTGSSGNPALSYAKSGMAFGANFIAGLPTMTTGDTDFETNLSNYFGNCGLPLAYSQGAMDTLANETDILSFFLNFVTDKQQQRFVSQVSGGTQSISTCYDAIKNINQTWTSNNQQYLNHVAHMVGFPNAVSTNFISAANMTSNDLLQVANGASDALKQSISMNLIYKSLFNNSTQVGNTSLANAVYDAQQFQQYQAGGVLSSDQAARVVPALKNFAEAMLFLLYPVMVFYALITTNIGVVIKYIKYSATVAAIPLMYEIISALIYWYTTEKTGGIMSEGGFNLMSASGLYSLNSSIVATANYLAMSTPLLAYALVSGSDMAITSIFSHGTDPAKAASSSAGTDEAKGNMNMGNTSIDNASMDNLASNKFNNAMDMTSGTSQMNNRYGSSTISNYQDGGSTIQTTVSSGAITDQVNNALEKQLSQSYSQAMQETKQSGFDLSNSYKEAGSYAQSHGLGWSGSHDKGTGVDSRSSVITSEQNRSTQEGSMSVSGSLGTGAGGGSAGIQGGIAAKDSHATQDSYGIDKSTISSDTNSWKHSELYNSDQQFKSMVDKTEASQQRYSENYTKTHGLQEQLQTAQKTSVSQSINTTDKAWQDALARNNGNAQAAAHEFNQQSSHQENFNSSKQDNIGQTSLHSNLSNSLENKEHFKQDFDNKYDSNKSSADNNSLQNVKGQLIEKANLIDKSEDGLKNSTNMTKGSKVNKVDHSNADGNKYGLDLIDDPNK